MLRHLLVFVTVILATTVMIGCGGKTDDRITGTDDTRILGDWVATELHYNDIIKACPGEIDDGSGQKLNCTTDTTDFADSGRYSVGTTTDDFYFKGGTLILYNRSGNGISFGVTFDDTGNRMTWTFNQNGRPAELIIDRVVL